MPTLNWIGKEAVVNHHHEVPFHLLKDVPELACGAPGSGNLIVQGDNLVALKALLPYYAGQVKCIYIDPPYNTGNEGWIYNDNVNSPLIRDWLTKTVGSEGEDLTRHDKWLCMMYPRLSLLRSFLSQEGVIFVSMDDNEITSLRILMDEIFGKECFVEQLIISRSENGMGSNEGFASNHEYMLAYKKCTESSGVFCGLSPSPDFLASFDKEDEFGKFKVDGLLRKKGAGARREESPNCFYPLYYNPKTGKVRLEPADGFEATLPKLPTGGDGRWTWSKDFAVGKEYRLHAGAKGTIYIKDYFTGLRREKPKSILRSPSYLTDKATNEIRSIFGDKVFTTPKPVGLIADLLDNLTDKNCLVLDSFAGSGTTGQAVLEQNMKDGGKRRFILVEIEPKIAREITGERVRRVAQGYTNAKGEKVDGLDGGFRFCELGEPLFNDHGQIRENVRFADLARHVYFSETGEPLPRERVPNSPKIGEHNGTAIYLLFNGILGDKSANGGNVLTRAVLAKLPLFAGPKVIFGAGCLLGADRLRAERVTFRQTPYEIKVR